MIELHVTFTNQESARVLARKALEQRLAACVNIVPQIRSLYWWDGEIAEEEETLAILKTSSALADTLVTLIEENHPYDTPAIIRHAQVTANAAYADWIAAETGKRTA